MTVPGFFYQLVHQGPAAGYKAYTLKISNPVKI
jgi:hypothetical protein